MSVGFGAACLLAEYRFGLVALLLGASLLFPMWASQACHRKSVLSRLSYSGQEEMERYCTRLEERENELPRLKTAWVGELMSGRALRLEPQPQEKPQAGGAAPAPMDRLEDDAARPLWMLSTLAFVAMGSMPQGILMGTTLLVIYILLYSGAAFFLGLGEDTLMHWFRCTLTAGAAAFLMTILGAGSAHTASIVVMALIWFFFLRS